MQAEPEFVRVDVDLAFGYFDVGKVERHDHVFVGLG